MKIKMLKTHADPRGVHLAGKEYEVGEALAKTLIDARAAVRVPGELEKTVKKLISKEEQKLQEPVEPPADPSELTQIDGISDKVAAGLAEHGIETLEDLADCTVDEITRIVKAADVGRGARNKESWAEQAQALLTQDAE